LKLKSVSYATDNIPGELGKDGTKGSHETTRKCSVSQSPPDRFENEVVQHAMEVVSNGQETGSTRGSLLASTKNNTSQNSILKCMIHNNIKVPGNATQTESLFTDMSGLFRFCSAPKAAAFEVDKQIYTGKDNTPTLYLPSFDTCLDDTPDASLKTSTEVRNEGNVNESQALFEPSGNPTAQRDKSSFLSLRSDSDGMDASHAKDMVRMETNELEAKLSESNIVNDLLESGSINAQPGAFQTVYGSEDRNNGSSSQISLQIQELPHPIEPSQTQLMLSTDVSTISPKPLHKCTNDTDRSILMCTGTVTTFLGKGFNPVKNMEKECSTVLTGRLELFPIIPKYEPSMSLDVLLDFLFTSPHLFTLNPKPSKSEILELLSLEELLHSPISDAVKEVHGNTELQVMSEAGVNMFIAGENTDCYQQSLEKCMETQNNSITTDMLFQQKIETRNAGTEVSNKCVLQQLSRTKHMLQITNCENTGSRCVPNALKDEVAYYALELIPGGRGKGGTRGAVAAATEYGFPTSTVCRWIKALKADCLKMTNSIYADQIKETSLSASKLVCQRMQNKQLPLHSGEEVGSFQLCGKCGRTLTEKPSGSLQDSWGCDHPNHLGENYCFSSQDRCWGCPIASDSLMPQEMETCNWVVCLACWAKGNPRLSQETKGLFPRTSRPCLECRRRKLRCDRMRPMCERCWKKHSVCTYEDPVSDQTKVPPPTSNSVPIAGRKHGQHPQKKPKNILFSTIHMAKAKNTERLHLSRKTVGLKRLHVLNQTPRTTRHAWQTQRLFSQVSRNFGFVSSKNQQDRLPVVKNLKVKKSASRCPQPQTNTATIPSSERKSGVMPSGRPHRSMQLRRLSGGLLLNSERTVPNTLEVNGDDNSAKESTQLNTELRFQFDDINATNSSTYLSHRVSSFDKKSNGYSDTDNMFGSGQIIMSGSLSLSKLISMDKSCSL